MKKQKQTRITSLFIAFALVISLCCTGIAQASEGPEVQILDDSTGSDAVRFYINGEGNAVIVGVTPVENATAITFPSSVTANSLSYDVVAIGDESAGLSILGSNEMNQNKTITSVIIPDSVTRIAPYAFLSCTALASVTLSKKLVSIGTCAFFGCTSLESIELPVTVTSIEVSAFYGTGINAQDKVESDKDGYTFNGLFTVNGGDLAINPSAGPALYSRWTPNTYEVSFNSQGGSPVNGKNVVFDTAYGELPITTRTGYTFDGWWTEPNGTGTEVTENTHVTIPADHTLYAKWIPDTYTVNFDTQDGTLTSGNESKIVTYGTTYGTMPEAERATYIFGGWWTERGGRGTKVTSATQVTITDTQTLYANWTRPKFTVTFDTQGGTMNFPHGPILTARLMA